MVRCGRHDEVGPLSERGGEGAGPKVAGVTPEAPELRCCVRIHRCALPAADPSTMHFDVLTNGTVNEQQHYPQTSNT